MREAFPLNSVTLATVACAGSDADFRAGGDAGAENRVTVRVEVAGFHEREVAAEGVTDGGRVVHVTSPERAASRALRRPGGQRDSMKARAVAQARSAASGSKSGRSGSVNRWPAPQ